MYTITSVFFFIILLKTKFIYLFSKLFSFKDLVKDKIHLYEFTLLVSTISSFASFPPFASFIFKFCILKLIFLQERTVLLFIVLFSSLLSLFYYWRIYRVLFMESTFLKSLTVRVFSDSFSKVAAFYLFLFIFIFINFYVFSIFVSFNLVDDYIPFVSVYPLGGLFIY